MEWYALVLLGKTESIKERGWYGIQGHREFQLGFIGKTSMANTSNTTLPHGENVKREIFPRYKHSQCH